MRTRGQAAAKRCQSAAQEDDDLALAVVDVLDADVGLFSGNSRPFLVTVDDRQNGQREHSFNAALRSCWP